MRSLLLIVVLLLTGCGGPHGDSDSKTEGRRAYKAGLPANCNPYKYNFESHQWFLGYLEEAEKHNLKGVE